MVDKRIDGGYVTPDESAGEDDVFISRMRLGFDKKSLGLWVVADNLRKGAALNTIQIAELIIKVKNYEKILKVDILKTIILMRKLNIVFPEQLLKEMYQFIFQQQEVDFLKLFRSFQRS